MLSDLNPTKEHTKGVESVERARTHTDDGGGEEGNEAKGQEGGKSGDIEGQTGSSKAGVATDG